MRCRRTVVRFRRSDRGRRCSPHSGAGAVRTPRSPDTPRRQRIPVPGPPGRRPVAWSRPDRPRPRRHPADRPWSRSPDPASPVRIRRSSLRSVPLSGPPRSRCTAVPDTVPAAEAHGGGHTGWRRSFLRSRGSRNPPESAPRAHRRGLRPRRGPFRSHRMPPSASRLWLGGRTRRPATPPPPTGRHRRGRCICPPTRFAPSPADRAPDAAGRPRWSNRHRGTVGSTAARRRRRVPHGAAPWGCRRWTAHPAWRSLRRCRRRTSARSSP